MGKKRIILCLLLTCVFLVFSKDFYLNNRPIVLSFDAKGSQEVVFQVFYEGNADRFFRVERSVQKNVDLLQTSTVNIDLPTDEISKIKIEIRPNKNVKISNITLNGKQKITVVDQNKIEKLRSSKIFDVKIFIIMFTLFFLFSYKVVQYLAKFKMSEHNSRIDIVFVSFFFAFLFIPMLRFSDETVSTLENRTLATYIPFLKDRIINNEYGKNFEAWFNDHFLGRKEFIKAHGQFMRSINLQKGNNQVLVGTQGWSFYKGDDGLKNFQNLNLFTQQELKTISAYLVSIDEWCRKHKKNFYFVIPPDKNKIYGEYITKIYKANPDSKSRANQLIRYLKENTRLKVLYLDDTLIAGKKDTLVYFKNDTHWSEFGAYLAYQELMRQIEKDTSIKAFEVSNWGTRKNITGDMHTNYQDLEEDPVSQYRTPQFETKYVCEGTTETLSCKNEGKTKKIILFRDSFATALVPYLASTFKNTHLLWRYNIAKQDLDFIKKNADVVVLETVERFLPHLSQMQFPKE